ncbi:MAG TPA: hypothetical protein VGL55_07750 [Steroidobacteraceae bacterium]|jgi:hypothetical protein
MKTTHLSDIESAPIYRICPRGAGRWEVSREASRELVAAFRDKSSALAYAMSLARASGDEKPALTTRPDALHNIIDRSRNMERVSA